MVNKREKNDGAGKTAVTTAPKSRLTSKKPPAAPRSAKIAPAAKTAVAAKKKAAKIRSEDIAFRAYLLGEKRQQLGLAGDMLGDWVEAERQLLVESATHGVN